MAGTYTKSIPDPGPVKMQRKPGNIREVRVFEQGKDWAEQELAKDEKGRVLYAFDALVQEGDEIIGDAVVHSPTKDVPEANGLGQFLTPVGKTSLTIGNNRNGRDLRLTLVTEGVKAR